MMDGEDNWTSDLEHDWDAEDDIYSSIYPGDVVGFIYNEKLNNGLVDSLLRNQDGLVNRIVIKNTPGPGTLHTYNTRGGSANSAIEHIFVYKEMMPDSNVTKEQLREKTFITINGVWGQENIGG